MFYIRYSIILTFNGCNAGSRVIKVLVEVTMPLFIAQLSLLSFVNAAADYTAAAVPNWGYEKNLPILALMNGIVDSI